jgi:hypothetical protein
MNGLLIGKRYLVSRQPLQGFGCGLVRMFDVLSAYYPTGLAELHPGEVSTVNKLCTGESS